MASSFFQRWASLFRNALQELNFVPHRARPQRSRDFQELADFLFHINQQMGRARIEYLTRGITKTQLQAVWQHEMENTKLLLCRAALPGRLPNSLLAERVLRALARWEHGARGVYVHSSQVADLRDLEHRLEDLANALVVYALAQRGQWRETQPFL